MKHGLATLCALLCVTANASAQSSVTLYGLIDQGYGFTNNAGGAKAWQTQSGYTVGNQWGLRGTESLGGGTSAIFTLENGFSLDNGTTVPGNLLFGRQAFVGLQDTHLGTLTLGRQYDAIQDYLAPLTSTGRDGGWPFAHVYDNDNAVATFRINNAVKYASPVYGGLQFGGAYAFSNSADGFRNNQGITLGAAYNRSALSLGAAYSLLNSPGTSATGAASSVDSNFVARRQQILGAGANYTWRDATFGLVYTHTTLDDPSSSVYFGTLPAGSNSLRFDNLEANVRYQITPSLIGVAMYTFTAGRYEGSSGNASPRWHQGGLMLDYLLSKRTFLYAQATYQHVAGNTGNTIFSKAYITGSGDISSTNSQVLARVGIRTVF